MKRSIYIFLISITFLSSCKKFLQQPTYNNISVDDIFNDFQGARTTLVGTYDKLKSINYCLRDLYMYPEVAGGNVKYSSLSNPQLLLTYNFTNDSINNDMKSFYALAYSIIYSANNILTYVNRTTDANQYQKNRMIADAYTFRALAYFDLVKTFAQPYNYTSDASHTGIILRNANTSVTASIPPKSTVKQVYNQIIADLDSAINLYPNSVDIYGTGSSKTWFSLDAATALLSRVSLYKQDWNTVITATSSLINSSSYSLITNAQYVSSWSGSNISSESIFELAYGTSIGGSLGDYFNTASTLYCQYATSKDLLSLYGTGDVRGQSTMFTSALINGTTYYFTNKYQGINSTANNIKILRLSEMYLSRAEAYAQTGKITNALADLNVIRKRANPSASSFFSSNAQTIISEILNERRRELCFEGHLFYDIARNNLNLVRNDCTATNASFTYPNNFYACPTPLNQ